MSRLVGVTKSLERPGGAFVWNGRVYVFANVSLPSIQGRPDPEIRNIGTYLLSTSTPDQPTPLTTHYLFSPRIGKCTLPTATVRSHQPLGSTSTFHALPPGRLTSWRRCKWCESLFDARLGQRGTLLR